MNNDLDLSSKRIMLTGGAGFLVSFVAEKLKARGYKHIFIPKEQNYDLTKAAAIEAAFKDAGKLFSFSPDSRLPALDLPSISSSTSPPKWGESAPTAKTPAASSTTTL